MYFFVKMGKFAKVILTNKITGGSAGDILRNFYNCPNLKVKRAQSPNRPLLQLGGRGREGQYPQGSWCAAPGNDLKLVFVVALTFYHQFTPPVRVASCNFVFFLDKAEWILVRSVVKSIPFSNMCHG